MEEDLHHPSPRLPDGWKQFQADNIDITTTQSEYFATMGRHSRSPSVLSNREYPTASIIQPSQIEQHLSHQNLDYLSPNTDDGTVGGDDGGDLLGLAPNSYHSNEGQSRYNNRQRSISPFGTDFANPEIRNNAGILQTATSSGTGNTAHHATTATLQEHHHQSTATNLNQNHLNTNVDSSGALTDNTINDDFYLTGPDAASSPFLNATNTSSPFANQTSPQLAQESLSPYISYGTAPSFNNPQYDTSAVDIDNTLNTNSFGLRWSHHRTLSDQSDLSSNASPFIGSVHSADNSPFIAPQQDTSFEEDLREAISGLDMGAPQFDPSFAAGQSFDPSQLDLDSTTGFPMDAPLFQQDRETSYYEQTSRPTSSSSYHQPGGYTTQSVFTSSMPHNISTQISPGFQSPPLPSATSIPEIEVTAAPPDTPRQQPFSDQPYNEYFPARSYSPIPVQGRNSGQNSPSFPPSMLQYNAEPPSLSLPSGGIMPMGRRRAASDSAARQFTLNPNSYPGASNPSFANTAGIAGPSGIAGVSLVRRVSSGSHPYLVVEGGGVGSRSSSPSRGHRKSFSHNMTHRDVLDLVKNEGPREAKNPKKFICDYPGCGQRFTRNSNKTTHMLTHKNERPHVCPHCGKDFTRQHDWKRHMELHDPSKKFKCAGFLADGRAWGCNKEFARKDALSRHFKSQQGRQCIEEVLQEGRTLEDLYEQQGIIGGFVSSGNSSEGMYDE